MRLEELFRDLHSLWQCQYKTFIRNLVDSSEVGVVYHVQKCSTGKSVLVDTPVQGSLCAGITCVKMQNIL